MNDQVPNGAPAGTEAPLTEGVQVPDGQQPDVAEILKFDPFAPAKPEAKPAGQEAEVKPGGKPGEAKPDAAAAKPAVGAPAKTPEQLIAEHTASIRQMLERAPQPAAAKTEDKQPDAPKFNLGIPDVLLNAMSSEDPKERSLATHALVNGVANAVWRETSQMVQQQIADLVAGWPRVIESHLAAREQQQQIHDDFYGTYQQFAGKQWIPLIQAHAAALMNEMAAAGQQITGWTPQMRDEIANRLFAEFPQLKDWKPPAGKPNGANPPKKPQFATGSGGGARPPAEAGPVSEMLAVLGKTN
jgi:hypothetical protein